MTIILGSRKSRITGKLLTRALNGTYTENNARNLTEEMIIRYGNSYIEDPEDMNILNTKASVQNVSNKKKAKEILTINSIPTPKLITFENALSGNAAFPLVVRKNTHFKGKYFYIVNNINDLRQYDQEHYYIQQLVDKIDEFRLFILKDRIIEANLKQVPEGTTPIVRNHEAGCYFRWIRVADLPRDLKRAARDAIQATGLDFGAIDCATIQTASGTRPTIFEINSAPGLIPRKVELFKNKLTEMNII